MRENGGGHKTATFVKDHIGSGARRDLFQISMKSFILGHSKMKPSKIPDRYSPKNLSFPHRTSEDLNPNCREEVFCSVFY